MNLVFCNSFKLFNNRGFDYPSHLSRGGGREYGSKREIDLELITNPRDQLGGQQRVASNLKKVIFDADRVRPEDLLPNRH